MKKRLHVEEMWVLFIEICSSCLGEAYILVGVYNESGGILVVHCEILLGLFSNVKLSQIKC